MTDIQTRAREAFEERFEDVLNGTEDLGPYWQDDIFEVADGLVPVYTHDRVQQWLDAGCPDLDDPGLVEGVTDVVQIIGVTLYEQYSQALYALADEYDFDAR